MTGGFFGILSPKKSTRGLLLVAFMCVLLLYPIESVEIELAGLFNEGDLPGVTCYHALENIWGV